MMHQAVSPSSLKAASPGRLAAFSPGRHPVSPASQYERVESNIGEGAYGKVHKARDLKTGRLVAIKKAKVSGVDQKVGGIGFTVLREIKLMQAVRHCNVMGLLDVYAEGGVLHLVMEFMETDLKKVIDDRSITLTEAHSKCLTGQLLSGLAALHSKWFVHRDVTPSNVLISAATGVARLTDFGFARTLGHEARPLTPMCTALWYRAPELLYGAKYYGTGVDIWSAGCVVAELLRRRVLFQGHSELDMMTEIFEKRGTPTEMTWRDVTALPTYLGFSHQEPVPMATVVETGSAAAHGLLERMLQLDPKERPSAEAARSMPFFTTALPAAADPLELPYVKQAGGTL